MTNISNEDLLYCLRVLDDRVEGKPSVRDMMDQDDLPSNVTIRRRFDGWSNALEEANILQKYIDGRWYYGKNWDENRRLAKERANYTCEHPDCTISDNLDTHHIIPHRIGVIRGYFTKEDGNDLDNLIILCKEHHNQLEPRSFYNI